MDDLMVIIITLVIAGVGILGQFKKKRPNPETEKEDGIPDNIMDFFNLTAHNPDFDTHFNHEYQPIEEESGQGVKKEVFDFDPKKEGGVLAKPIHKTSDPIKNIKVKSKNKFPLRKAVIYSEILHRKYT